MIMRERRSERVKKEKVEVAEGEREVAEREGERGRERDEERGRQRERDVQSSTSPHRFWLCDLSSLCILLFYPQTLHLLLPPPLLHSAPCSPLTALLCVCACQPVSMCMLVWVSVYVCDLSTYPKPTWFSTCRAPFRSQIQKIQISSLVFRAVGTFQIPLPSPLAPATLVV